MTPSDEVILTGAITITAIIMFAIYDIFEAVYWKYIDWRTSREKDKGDG